jgi:prepilin-type N-terminal cleavage/methylation domain-containing protein
VRRLKKCLRAEEGMTLIELLIAMVVMSIGIAALVAGFSSGVVSINRARVTSTAGTLADKQMELYRQAAFTSLPMGLQTPTTAPGPDGQTYWMQVEGAWTCAVGTYVAGNCNVVGTEPANRPVKLVTITVREGAPPARILFTESATFDSSTG